MLPPFIRLLLVWLSLTGSAFAAFVSPSVQTKAPARSAFFTGSTSTQRLAHSSSDSRHAITMMPATLEKAPSVLDRPAVLDRPETTTTKRVDEPVKERKDMGSEAWEVRIYNDGLNTREHVARALVQVTGMSEIGAYQTMMTAHQNGIAVVGRWVYEVAEMYHDALKKNGIVCDLVPVEEE